jgi:hypothetical protein
MITGRDSVGRASADVTGTGILNGPKRDDENGKVKTK